jgi:diaminopimelate decarboxylase
MSDTMRPMLNDTRYEAMLAKKATVQPDVVVTFAGKHCESGDVFVRDGRSRQIVEREAREDVLRLQRPIHQ